MPRDLNAEPVASRLDRQREICVLVNGGAGSSQSLTVSTAILSAARSVGVPIVLRQLQRRPSVEMQASLARDEGFGTIVAAGGDGTIAAVANALADRPGHRLGIIPLGTFNYLARSLGIPTDIAAAVRLLVEGGERKLNAGRLNGKLFLNNASLGAYPALLESREKTYRDWGRSRIAAYGSALASLLRKADRLVADITVDGQSERVAAPLVFAVTNPYQIDCLKLAGGDEVRAGRIALFIAPTATRAEMIRRAAGLALGGLEPGRDYRLLTGRDILITPHPVRQRIARDGEWQRAQGPFRFVAAPSVLRVIAPVEKTET